MKFLQTNTCLVLNVQVLRIIHLKKDMTLARIGNDCVLFTRLGHYIEETIVLEVYDLDDFIGVSESAFEEKLLQGIIMLYPVMLLKRPNQEKAIMNVNEMLLKPSFFTFLFNDKSEVNINKESNTAHKTLTASPAPENVTTKLLRPNKGRKPLYETYPELVSCVTNFLKQNSFVAERRRRTSTATGTGVTFEEIRNHIYETIPELRKRGISKSAIHNLFAPP